MRTSDSGVREIWSTIVLGPWPAKSVTASSPGLDSEVGGQRRER